MKMNPTREINRLCFGSLLNEARGKAVTQSNGVTGFRSCGIIPFNFHAIPDFAYLKLGNDPENEARDIELGPEREEHEEMEIEREEREKVESEEKDKNSQGSESANQTPPRSKGSPQPGCSTWLSGRTRPPRNATRSPVVDKTHSMLKSRPGNCLNRFPLFLIFVA